MPPGTTRTSSAKEPPLAAPQRYWFRSRNDGDAIRWADGLWAQRRAPLRPASGPASHDVRRTWSGGAHGLHRAACGTRPPRRLRITVGRRSRRSRSALSYTLRVHAISAAMNGSLAFTPVPVRARYEGWTPDRQRAFIGHLATRGLVKPAARSIPRWNARSTVRRCRSSIAAGRWGSAGASTTGCWWRRCASTRLPPRAPTARIVRRRRDAHPRKRRDLPCPSRPLPNARNAALTARANPALTPRAA